MDVFMMRSGLLAVAISLSMMATGFFAPQTFAQSPISSCKAADFSAAVDSAGANLRAFNSEAAPKLQSRIKAMADKKGWPDQDVEDKVFALLEDPKLAAFDTTANELLAKVDTLGSLQPGQAPDCAKLDELKATGIELLATMKAKSNYLIGRLDKELADKGTGSSPADPVAAAPAPKAIEALKPTVTSPTRAESATKVEPKLEPKPAPVAKAELPPTGTAVPSPKVAPVPATSWSSTTAPAPLPSAPPVDVAVAQPVPDPRGGGDSLRPGTGMLPPAAVLLPDEGYTIDEIRDATRGFFGGVSTGLAAVIEHAFQKSGRPTGYILGREGGGAFLGGLRYGEGQLYVRSGGGQKIYWHGPSIGFDFGAAATRTLFLIYKMDEPANLYRTFTGIDGSAFVVGGVGLTLLGGGRMILAPIRSGIGVRVGANIGYLRFTPQQTWNPF
jgi:hypothetical protein